MVELAVELLELEDLADEEVAVTMRHLRVRDVDHVVIDVEVQLGAALELAVQAAGALGPDDVLHLVLEAQQVDGERGVLARRVALAAARRRHEGGQLHQRQRRVQLQVRADGRQHLLLADLVHEHLGLVFDGVLAVVGAGLDGRRAGRQELGAGEREAALELGQVAVLHLEHLFVVVLLAEHLLDALVDALRVQHQADGQQVVHLLRLLIDLVVLVRARGEQLLGALHVQQGGRQGPDGVSVAAHHHVREAHVVGGGDLARRHVRVLRLLVQLDVLQHLDGLVVISKQRMKTKQPHEREVAQHLVQRVAPELARHRVGVAAGRVHLKLALDVRLVHEGVQHIEDAEHVPRLVLCVERVYLRLAQLGGAGPILRERLELIDKLVNQLPEPLVGQLERHRGLRGQDVVEQVTVVVEGLEALLGLRPAGNAGVDVAVVQLGVQDHEHMIIINNGCHFILIRPGGILKILLGQFGESSFIQIQDLVCNTLVYHIPEIHKEFLNHVWHFIVRSIVLQIILRISGMGLISVLPVGLIPSLVIVVTRIHISVLL